MQVRFVLTACLLLGCAYTGHDSLAANGEDGALFFSGATAPDVGVVPLGTSRTIQVDRLPGGDVTCYAPGMAGGHPDLLSPTTCNAPPDYPIVLDSASCDADACDVTSTIERGHLTLHVSGKSAGATKLHVVVHGTSDGAVHSDSVAIAFAPAGRIELQASPYDLAPLRAPVLPGVSFSPPAATVLDAAGHAMSVDPHALTYSVDGDAFTAKQDGTLVAGQPGHTTLEWQIPGAISRKVNLEVVSPSDVTSLEVSPSPWHGYQSAVDFDAPVPSGGAPLSSIETSSATVGLTFATRAVLLDGRRALPFLDATTVTPSSLGLDVRPEMFEAWDFTIWSAPAAGQGTLEVRADGLVADLPLSVSAP